MKQNKRKEKIYKEDDFQKVANKVSLVSIVGNVLLSLVKLLAGIVAHSNAMISDAIHSASDVFSTFVVIVGIQLASKEADKEHPYGHERLECVAAILLAMVLFMTGLGIGMEAFKTILNGNYQDLKTPGMLALFAAIASIISKEGMYWYTRYHAKRIDSSALMADAWHHRSDAFSSIGALIGILGARMGYPVMDSVASLVIFVFIVKASYDIFKDAMDKMVDHSCDKKQNNKYMIVLWKIKKFWVLIYFKHVFLEIRFILTLRFKWMGLILYKKLMILRKLYTMILNVGFQK